jgi:hypothetical protein
LPKENQTGPKNSQKRSRPPLRPDVESDLAGRDPGLEENPLSDKALLDGPDGAFGSRSLAKQASWLKDERFSTGQRQALAAHIGQIQGNRHLQRVIAAASARPAPGRIPAEVQLAPSPPTRADQEAEAAETMTRLHNIHREMMRHSNRTVRNTARLFVRRHGEPARLRINAMTLRSDSASAVRSRGEDPNTTAYFFYGRTQNNSHRFGPNTIGTVDGDTIIVRGKNSRGRWQSPDAIMGTFAHEASHILVSAYGEHPATDTSASSFDRYKDEFRAYWIEPVGRWARMRADDNKARAIKEHMVGTSATSTTGYSHLRNRYWTDAAFRRQVDAHRRPDGFNLSNNPNLDRLFRLLQGVSAGSTFVNQILSHIVRHMSPSERSEAAASPLIQRMTRALGGDDTSRVNNALRYPRTGELAGGLNPANSPRVTAFLEAIAHEDGDAMKDRYRALTAQERGSMYMNPAPVMVFIDRQVTIGEQRASAYAMIVSGRIDQFDAMTNFLEACFDAYLETALGTLSGVPAALRRTLNRLVYRSRLALYRLVEDVRREHVDVLPDPLKRRVLHALREGENL